MKTLNTVLKEALAKLNLSDKDIFKPKFKDSTAELDWVVYVNIKWFLENWDSISFAAYNNGNIVFSSYNKHNKQSQVIPAKWILAKIASLSIKTDTLDNIS